MARINRSILLPDAILKTNGRPVFISSQDFYDSFMEQMEKVNPAGTDKHKIRCQSILRSFQKVLENELSSRLTNADNATYMLQYLQETHNTKLFEHYQKVLENEQPSRLTNAVNAGYMLQYVHKLIIQIFLNIIEKCWKMNNLDL